MNERGYSAIVPTASARGACRRIGISWSAVGLGEDSEETFAGRLPAALDCLRGGVAHEGEECEPEPSLTPAALRTRY
jgi:hypothetical protein